MSAIINNWVCVDADSYQYVKCSFKSEEGGEYNHYKLIQMDLINPDTQEYEVFFDELCVDDYLDSMRSELLMILSSYGYGDDDKEEYEDCAEIIERMIKYYGEDTFQIICECIFEYYGSFQAEVLFTGSEQDCIKFIENYCENN